MGSPFSVRIIYICLVGVLAAGCATRPNVPRTHAWALPCDSCIDGISNFAQVNEKLWRGAQPDMNDPDIFIKLAKRGVKTVINLRYNHDDFARLKQTDIRYLWIPMLAWHPREPNLVIFLGALREAFADPNQWPVLVHCEDGKDRTGYAIATYRVVEEQWEAESAIQEMFDFRYNAVFFRNPTFVRRMQQTREEVTAKVDRLP